MSGVFSLGRSGRRRAAKSEVRSSSALPDPRGTPSAQPRGALERLPLSAAMHRQCGGVCFPAPLYDHPCGRAGEIVCAEIKMARRFGVSRKVITSDGVAVPTLSNSESTPPGTTIYVKLDLQIKETPPEVGIFIPDGFELGSHIDLLLYMRGFKIADEVVSVESYFKQSYGKLREGVNSSGRNVILVAPALGPISQAGTLVKPGGSTVSCVKR